MTIDLSKLTPAPWRTERRYSNGCEIIPRIKCTPDSNRECGWIADLIGAPYLGYESTLVNAEFIALARNAFDVMLRRGWCAIQQPSGRWAVKIDWSAIGNSGGMQSGFAPQQHADPFTALVETDAWYKENVEGKDTP